MILLTFLEVSVTILAAWVLLFQIIIPAFSGRPMFPMLRRVARLSDDLERAREEKDERELEKQIDKFDKQRRG